jgi:hypothetical protein
MRRAASSSSSPPEAVTGRGLGPETILEVALVGQQQPYRVRAGLILKWRAQTTPTDRKRRHDDARGSGAALRTPSRPGAPLTLQRLSEVPARTETRGTFGPCG